MRAVTLLIVVTTAVASAQTVLINKFQNGGVSGRDAVELLVVKNMLDLRGMILKDFSDSSGALSDAGGVYRFSNHALWSALASGTLIVLRRDSTTLDTAQSDFVLDVSFDDKSYFELVRAKFDILSSGDVVMIKAAQSATDGVAGSIHAFGMVLGTAEQAGIPRPFLYSSKSVGTNKFLFAKNSSQSLTDFDGKGTDTSTALKFGEANNATNKRFIDSLRSLSEQAVHDLDKSAEPFKLVQSASELRIETTLGSEILPMDVRVFNVLGSCVRKIRVDTFESTLDLSAIAAGQYFISIRSSAHSVTLPFFIDP